MEIRRKRKVMTRTRMFQNLPQSLHKSDHLMRIKQSHQKMDSKKIWLLKNKKRKRKEKMLNLRFQLMWTRKMRLMRTLEALPSMLLVKMVKFAKDKNLSRIDTYKGVREGQESGLIGKFMAMIKSRRVRSFLTSKNRLRWCLAILKCLMAFGEQLSIWERGRKRESWLRLPMDMGSLRMLAKLSILKDGKKETRGANCKARELSTR